MNKYSELLWKSDKYAVAAITESWFVQRNCVSGLLVTTEMKEDHRRRSLIEYMGLHLLKRIIVELLLVIGLR